MEKILIGRVEEKRILLQSYEKKESRFVAVLGRRRVGKTFLIRQVLGDKLSF
jgi:uncharacterized protein